MALFFQRDSSNRPDSRQRESFSDELAYLFQAMRRQKRSLRLKLLSACRLLLCLSLLAALVFSAHYWLNGPDGRSVGTSAHEPAVSQIEGYDPIEAAESLAVALGLSVASCSAAIGLTIVARGYIRRRWPV